MCPKELYSKVINILYNLLKSKQIFTTHGNIIAGNSRIPFMFCSTIFTSRGGDHDLIKC